MKLIVKLAHHPDAPPRTSGGPGLEHWLRPSVGGTIVRGLLSCNVARELRTLHSFALPQDTNTRENIFQVRLREGLLWTLSHHCKFLFLFVVALRV
jgi:hypothetical protein